MIKKINLTISRWGSCVTLGLWSPDHWAVLVFLAAVYKKAAWNCHWCSDCEKPPSPSHDPQSGNMTGGPKRGHHKWDRTFGHRRFTTSSGKSQCLCVFSQDLWRSLGWSVVCRYCLLSTGTGHNMGSTFHDTTGTATPYRKPHWEQTLRIHIAT